MPPKSSAAAKTEPSESHSLVANFSKVRGIMQRRNENKQWSNKTVNHLLFLLLGSPTHQLPEKVNYLKNAIKTGKKKGIRIIPIYFKWYKFGNRDLLSSLSTNNNNSNAFITNDSSIATRLTPPTVC